MYETAKNKSNYSLSQDGGKLNHLNTLCQLEVHWLCGIRFQDALPYRFKMLFCLKYILY